MKSLLLAVLLIFVSCGKDNESGRPTQNLLPEVIPLEVRDAIKQDFLVRGSELLRIHGDTMRRIFDPRFVNNIRVLLVEQNVQTTDRLIINDRNEVTQSYQRQGRITLYVGEEEPELSWRKFNGLRSPSYDRWVMHELLRLGGIQDLNFGTTDRILQRRL